MRAKLTHVAQQVQPHAGGVCAALSATDTVDEDVYKALTEDGGMLDDTFTLLDVERRRDPHDIPLQCGGFDLIWNHGPVPSFLPGAASRIGGCNAAHEYESLSSRAITL